VVADIPGLIAGAHKGAGLGTQFLRHIERTRLLVHLIDACEIDPDHVLAAYETVNQELVKHNPALAQRPQILVLNKIDMPGAEKNAALFQEAMPEIEVVSISALKGKGTERLLSRIVNILEGN
jgi:GTP-binding protein